MLESSVLSIASLCLLVTKAYDSGQEGEKGRKWKCADTHTTPPRPTALTVERHETHAGTPKLHSTLPPRSAIPSCLCCFFFLFLSLPIPIPIPILSIFLCPCFCPCLASCPGPTIAAYLWAESFFSIILFRTKNIRFICLLSCLLYCLLLLCPNKKRYAYSKKQ
jgi:hypothetical protein